MAFFDVFFAALDPASVLAGALVGALLAALLVAITRAAAPSRWRGRRPGGSGDRVVGTSLFARQRDAEIDGLRRSDATRWR